MTDLFWQVYFFAMVLVFSLRPFAPEDSRDGWKTIWEVRYKDVAWALVLGSIPLVNAIFAFCIAMGFTFSMIDEHIFQWTGWNKYIFNRRKIFEK